MAIRGDASNGFQKVSARVGSALQGRHPRCGDTSPQKTKYTFSQTFICDPPMNGRFLTLWQHDTGPFHVREIIIFTTRREISDYDRKRKNGKKNRVTFILYPLILKFCFVCIISIILMRCITTVHSAFSNALIFW